MRTRDRGAEIYKQSVAKDVGFLYDCECFTPACGHDFLEKAQQVFR